MGKPGSGSRSVAWSPRGVMSSAWAAACRGSGAPIGGGGGVRLSQTAEDSSKAALSACHGVGSCLPRTGSAAALAGAACKATPIKGHWRSHHHHLRTCCSARLNCRLLGNAPLIRGSDQRLHGIQIAECAERNLQVPGAPVPDG